MESVHRDSLLTRSAQLTNTLIPLWPKWNCAFTAFVPFGLVRSHLYSYFVQLPGKLLAVAEQQDRKTKQSRAFKSITRCWERNNNTEKWIKKYVHYLSKINIKQIMLAILSVFFFCLLAFIVLCSSTKMLSSILTFHILLSNASSRASARCLYSPIGGSSTTHSCSLRPMTKKQDRH